MARIMKGMTKERMKRIETGTVFAAGWNAHITSEKKKELPKQLPNEGMCAYLRRLAPFKKEPALTYEIAIKKMEVLLLDLDVEFDGEPDLNWSIAFGKLNELIEELKAIK